MFELHCFIGSVGSGKTTRVKDWPKHHPSDPTLCFFPGQILRGAVGSGFFNTNDGNAPRCCDEFVFGSWLQHYALARKLGRVAIASDGWPRTGLQAAALVQWLHRSGEGVSIFVHHLLCSESEWESRLKADRWKVDPSLESLDRERYAASIEDSLGAVSVLRTTGEPFVKSIRIYQENQQP
jgi:hypothetical protein